MDDEFPIFTPQGPAESFLEDLQEELEQEKRSAKAGTATNLAVILPGGREVYPNWFGARGQMLILQGFDEKQRDCRVLVAYSAVTIVLTKVPATEPRAARPIGFQSRREATPKAE
ncbi:MAG TPA: hypothetical protein VGD94_12360 [Vicinamibacterales bacterium]